MAEDVVFAERISRLSPSPIRKISGLAESVRQKGKKVYALNIGQPDSCFIPEFGKAINEKIKTGCARYAPYIGLKDLRSAYADYLNNYFNSRNVKHLTVNYENIHVTVGASEAITSTFLTICDPGDEVLTVEPFFTPYQSFLAVAGGILKAIPTKAEENFALPSYSELEKHITPKTKAFIINSPNNPSGKVFTLEELEVLGRLCAVHGLFLICDEVYREIYFGETNPGSLLQIDLKDERLNNNLRKHLIVIDSCSKLFSLCGIRIGFAAADKEVVNKIALCTAQTVACVSDILQYGASEAYKAILKNSEFITSLRDRFKERLAASLSAIKEYLPNVIVPEPEGTFYLLLKFPEIEDAEDFALFMLNKFSLDNETVAFTPADSFYLTKGAGRNEIRTALVLPPNEMKRSFYLISQGLKQYLKTR